MARSTRERQHPRRTVSILALSAVLVGMLAVSEPAGATTTIVNGKISFNRADLSLDTSRGAFTIDPDGSRESKVLSDGDVGCREWSPDSSKLLCGIFLPTGWPRPATANPDGTGFAVLDGYPNQALFLAPHSGHPTPPGSCCRCPTALTPPPTASTRCGHPTEAIWRGSRQHQIRTPTSRSATHRTARVSSSIALVTSSPTRSTR